MALCWLEPEGTQSAFVSTPRLRMTHHPTTTACVELAEAAEARAVELKGQLADAKQNAAEADGQRQEAEKDMLEHQQQNEVAAWTPRPPRAAHAPRGQSSGAPLSTRRCYE